MSGAEVAGAVAGAGVVLVVLVVGIAWWFEPWAIEACELHEEDESC